jgi:hypothetical protein
MYELLAGSLRSEDLRTEELLDGLFFSPLGCVWMQPWPGAPAGVGNFPVPLSKHALIFLRHANILT